MIRDASGRNPCRAVDAAEVVMDNAQGNRSREALQLFRETKGQSRESLDERADVRLFRST
jgi:DNA-binding protein